MHAGPRVQDLIHPSSAVMGKIGGLKLLKLKSLSHERHYHVRDVWSKKRNMPMLENEQHSVYSKRYHSDLHSNFHSLIRHVLLCFHV